MSRQPEFEDIQRALSVPNDCSRWGMTRRRFLQMSAAGMTVATVGPMVGKYEALAGQRLAHDEGVVVMVQLGGGNDGMNTLIPIGQGRYRDLRGNLAYDHDEVLHLGDGVALHPALSSVKQRWDMGQVAIVQGIGYADSSLSHFDSIAHWHNGRAGSDPSEPATDGWLGRWLDGLGNGRTELEAVVFDSTIPLHLRGQNAAAIGLSLNGGANFGLDDDADDLRMYDAYRAFAAEAHPRGPWADAVSGAGMEALALAGRLSPAYEGPGLSGSTFERQMARAARLISADVGVRVLGVSLGGFDTHGGQAGSHQSRLTDFDRGIQQFFDNLDARFASRVTVATFSEFGRRPEINGSRGTDHGTASCAFVIGSKVAGGLVGQYPSLTNLDSRGNLRPEVDFRSMYATVLDTWLRSDSNQVLEGSFESLPLFRGSPGNRDVINPPPDPEAHQGYIITTDAGGVFNFGHHPSYGGGAAGMVAALEPNPAGAGYWLCTTGGAIEPFGDAPYLGSMAGTNLDAPMVDMAVHPDGDGYWLLGGDGGVFSFGNVGFYGSTGGLNLRQPVVGMAPHPNGRGYWFVASDGGVFSFGSSRFHGSTGGISLRRPVVGMAGTATGRGYWLVADDGGIFAFGDATFHGATGGLHLARPVVSMPATPSGKGYWLVADDGGIFAFGDAAFHGSLGAQTVPGRVIGIAA